MAEILCGFLAGLIVGVIISGSIINSVEEKYRKSGYINLNGEFFRLEKLPENRDAP